MFVSYLDNPYPYFHRGKELTNTALLLFLIGFSLLYLLEPFERDYNQHLYSYVIICAAHSGVALVVYLAYFSILNLFVEEDDWNLRKELFAVAGLLFFIGSGEFFVRYFIYTPDSSLGVPQYFEELLHAFLVGPLIIFIIAMVKIIRLSKKNKEVAGQFSLAIQKPQDAGKIQLKAGVETDNFDVAPSDILCIKSDGNYLEFFVKGEDEYQKLLKRMTLQSALDQLGDFPFIFKTHRAYLVNLLHLEEVNGNAQGYQLKVQNLDFTIPVSRANINEFNAVMN